MKKTSSSQPSASDHPHSSMKNEHALLRKILGGERKRLRHHVTATVTEEGQWDQPEANNGLARMFVIMLLLHIVVIGAIVLYDFVGEEGAPQPSPAVAAHRAGNPAPARANAPVAAAIPVTPQQAALAATAPAASAEFDIYEVKDGDTIASVIKGQRVDREEFLRLNSLASADAAIETHSILRLPKNRLPAPAATVTPEPQPATATAVVDEPAALPASTTTPAASEAPAPSPAAADSPAMVSIPIVPPTAEELAASVKPVSVPAINDEPAPATDAPPAPEKPKPLALTQPRPVPTPSEMAKKPIVKQEPPAPAAKKSDTAKASKPASGKGTNHTLAKGETLYRVAMKHGVSVNDIIRANNIKDPAKLRDGTRLVIPAK